VKSSASLGSIYTSVRLRMSIDIIYEISNLLLFYQYIINCSGVTSVGVFLQGVTPE